MNAGARNRQSGEAEAADDRQLLRAARAGDESAFIELMERYHGRMVAVASAWVAEADRTRIDALLVAAWEEVLGDGGELPSLSVQTRILRSVVRCARALDLPAQATRAEHAVSQGPDAFTRDGGWCTPPRRWTPDVLCNGAVARSLQRALSRLPSAERAAVQLRDVLGISLVETVRDGRFRADLLYRLNVFPIEVPPLRERGADIPLLVGSFVAALARKLGKPLAGFSPKSLDAMRKYSWPGNVRELQNIVERAAILASGPVLELDPSMLQTAGAQAGPGVPAAGSSMDEMQRTHIETVLRSTGGVIDGQRGAAALLGMHPNTLRSRMKRLGIAPLRSRA